MSTVTASAPGKIILFGEHAVVYGQPALAVPLTSVQATATIVPGEPGEGLVIEARDLNTRLSLAEAATEALTVTAKLVLARLQQPEPDAVATIQSTIPVASGLGSGAAVSAALARALAEYLGNRLTDQEVSELVFEVEKIHHGTPSGIDNTVVCYARPVFFVRSQAPETFHPAKSFHLIIGDTGIASPTRLAVGAVREAWQNRPLAMEALFTQVGNITRSARLAIESGDVAAIGPLMNDNQRLLEQMGVSSPELERLIHAARGAGADGAKLSGGGRGGNMIAITPQELVRHVSETLVRTGAKRVMHTVITQGP